MLVCNNIVISCYVMLYHIMLYHMMLCHATLHHIHGRPASSEARPPGGAGSGAPSSPAYAAETEHLTAYGQFTNSESGFQRV